MALAMGNAGGKTQPYEQMLRDISAPMADKAVENMKMKS